MSSHNFSLIAFSILILLSFFACNDKLNPEKNTKTETPIDLANATVQTPLSTIVKSETDSSKINQYKDNKKDGFWRTHFQNGQLKSEGNYKLGLKEGLHKQWESSGILSLEGYYKNGKANGLMKWYHGEGHLAAFGNMIDGIRHGPWRICDVEDTGFCIDANFENGKREGIWKINHEKAPDKIWKEQTWKDDKIVSERCWDEHGEVIECKEI